jgi:glutathione synthase/RimK-type ligase-like ATP-grasp enzyme
LGALARVGIVGAAGDAIVAALARALAENEKVEPLVLDPFRYPDERVFGVDPAVPSFTYEGRPIDDVAAFFVRQIVLPMPYFFRPAPGAERLLFRNYYRQSAEAQARFGFLVSLLVALAEEGREVVNPIRNGWPPTLKTLQLRRLARAGVPVPRTLVTSAPEEAAAFLEAVPDAVVKPVQGGAQARRVGDEERRRLALIRQAPAIFQERIEGESLRLTLLAGEPLSCCRIRSEALDYRADPAYARGENVYERIACPPDLLDLARRAAGACGLVFTGIDLKRRGPGDYVFLELNASPAYLGIERWTKEPITAGLARWLAARAKEIAPSLPARSEGPPRRPVRPVPAETLEALADPVAFLEARGSFFEYVLPP